MSVSVVGLIGILVFYVTILIIGIWAGSKRKRQAKNEKREDGEENKIDTSEDILVAGRSLGLVIGSITLTATWVGGGFINGTSEAMFRHGLVAVQGPFGYTLSLMTGGLLFAEKMRSRNYVTMIDPFQEKYGSRMGGLMYIPALLGEIFWSGSILAALGASISVVIDIESDASIIVSACFAIGYTFVGGLYSVAYTDIVQLTCIFVGLWMAVPFAMTNHAVGHHTEHEWLGQWDTKKTGIWIDKALLLVFGGIPWQVYFQRVLACKKAKHSKYLSLVAGFNCLVMAIPPLLIGTVAKSTDWSKTDYKQQINGSLPLKDASRVLPLVLQYLTPTAVAFIGLGAVSAAVMSSADSSILSASSMFARNVYKVMFKPGASEREMLWVIRISICCVGVCATVMALKVKSIYGLWAFSSDLVYAILFPQLCCVIYFNNSNSYGAISGYIVGVILRIGGGLKLIGLKPFIHYPYYSETDGQLFPFRTLTMLCSMLTIIIISQATKYLFHNGVLPKKYDILQCFDTALLECSGSQVKREMTENSHLLGEIVQPNSS